MFMIVYLYIAYIIKFMRFILSSPMDNHMHIQVISVYELEGTFSVNICGAFL